ncbi:hypothetical protein FKM82_008051 [Ascaphus truei]
MELKLSPAMGVSQHIETELKSPTFPKSQRGLRNTDREDNSHRYYTRSTHRATDSHGAQDYLGPPVVEVRGGDILTSTPQLCPVSPCWDEEKILLGVKHVKMEVVEMLVTSKII